MIRIRTVWTAALGVLLVACSRDKARDGAADSTGTPPETAAPVPAPAPAMDSMHHDTSSRDTAAAQPDNMSAKPAPSPNMSQHPAPGSAPAVPKPDSSKIKPNIDPKRVADLPKVPKPSQDTASSAPLRDQYHQAPRDTVSQIVYNGWKQFNLNCARCHGEDVQGTTIAPHLILSLKPDGPINTKELFMTTVCEGRPTKGMPAWCQLGLDNEKIEQIYAYVKGRSDAKIGPGRPAVRP